MVPQHLTTDTTSVNLLIGIVDLVYYIQVGGPGFHVLELLPVQDVGTLPRVQLHCKRQDGLLPLLCGTEQGSSTLQPLEHGGRTQFERGPGAFCRPRMEHRNWYMHILCSIGLYSILFSRGH